MFVRWKSRRWRNTGRKAIERPESECLYAQLVESTRKKGKPRQRVVLHLGSIQRADLEHKDHVSREDTAWGFWHGVLERLAGMEVTGDQRAAMLATVARVVPLPPGYPLPEAGPTLQEQA
jgi:hypothetical protein